MKNGSNGDEMVKGVHLRYFRAKLVHIFFQNAARIDSAFQIYKFSPEKFSWTAWDMKFKFLHKMCIIILEMLAWAFYIRIKIFWLGHIFQKQTDREADMQHNSTKNWETVKSPCQHLKIYINKETWKN